MNRFRMYINGERAEAGSGSWFPVYDPSTEAIIAEVPDADAPDVDRAVKAARAAFDSGPWAQMTAQDRGRLLFKLSDRIRTEAGKLAELEARNCGKPIIEAEFDINDAATCFEYYGGLVSCHRNM
jgi:betaine-aldehyde dehydrogenase